MKRGSQKIISWPITIRRMTTERLTCVARNPTLVQILVTLEIDRSRRKLHTGSHVPPISYPVRTVPRGVLRLPVRLSHDLQTRLFQPEKLLQAARSVCGREDATTHGGTNTSTDRCAGRRLRPFRSAGPGRCRRHASSRSGSPGCNARGSRHASGNSAPSTVAR